MPKSSRLEYGDVQAIIDRGSQDASWVRQELGGVDLGDSRLNRRLITTGEHLARSPISPINEACGTWADTKASYRLFNNAKATPAAILRPHKIETVKRMAVYGGPVLVIQDTVFVSYGKHPNTTGLGPIGRGHSSTERGLIMHNAFAVTTSGVPLGILSQRIWSRKDTPNETNDAKHDRIKLTSLDEKESSKWLLALRETIDHAPFGVKLVTIADRESDFFEFMMEANNLRAPFVIRARVDRRLDPEEGFATITEAIGAAPVAGTLTIQIPGNGKRKSRSAEVEVRIAEVSIRPPQRRGKAKATESYEPLTTNVISVTEVMPPDGCDGLAWVLFTNLPVKNFDDASQKVDWYSKRWGIETWHKVLKSGCKVEDCLLETADRLMRFLALFSIIAFRLMHITYLARVNSNAPSTQVFSDEEVEALHIRVKKTRLPAGKTPTLGEAIQMIGVLGGHLGRASDGEPGITVVWRGLMRLYEDVEMLRAHKQVLAQPARAER